MSRCIDADILVQDTIQEYARSKQYRDAIIRMVNKAPTVEPKRGYWAMEDGAWWCSACGEFAYRLASMKPLLSDFCPNCGADMRGKDDE